MHKDDKRINIVVHFEDLVVVVDGSIVVVGDGVVVVGSIVVVGDGVVVVVSIVVVGDGVVVVVSIVVVGDGVVVVGSIVDSLHFIMQSFLLFWQISSQKHCSMFVFLHFFSQV